MKKTLSVVLLVVATVSAYAGVQLNVNVGEPDFYGSIDVGTALPPPGMLTPAPGAVFSAGVAPMYLHVLANHAHNWSRYCNAYNACGRPVYFVNDNWYRTTYAPRYRKEHPMRHDEHHEDHRQ